MRRRLVPALLVALLPGGSAAAQVLDDTMVPRGQLRMQAHPAFITWDARFGRDADGVAGVEELGLDLTDPTGAILFPGMRTQAQILESLSGVAGYDPVLGSSRGRVTQDITRVEFGGHLGIFDWLTIGMIVPWIQNRTALDYAFEPDSAGGADLGLSPTINAVAGVDSYLAALDGAASAAQANATAVCAGGAGAACTAAQALAGRTADFFGSLEGAYGASPFFPMAGSAMAAAIAGASSTLDSDLAAAGITGIGLPPAFATAGVTEDAIVDLPTSSGAGIAGAPLATRTALWQTGDIEISAQFRLLERLSPTGMSGLSFRLTAGFLARLPTGTPEDPDIFLDVGTGDGQRDYEGRVAGLISYGRLGIAAGTRYGVQGATTVTKRVAAPEVVLPPLSTRALVRFEPASYLVVDVAPRIRLTDELSLTGQYRVFSKARDRYSLIDPSLPLDPLVLSRESGLTVYQIGGGLRYDTVEQWAADAAATPLELHLRVIRTVSGSGGHAPRSARVEAGLRLFKRFWGPDH